MKITEKVKIALKKVLSLQLSKAETDNGTLIWEDGIDLAEGVEVFVEDSDAEDGLKAAPDGDYKTEDGKVIKVADGKVAEIVDPEAEVAPEENEALVKFNAHKVEMAATYNEILQNIQAAVNAQGLNGWVCEAASDYAIVSLWTGEKEVYFRYELTTAEDGTITLGERSEVKPAFVTVEKAEPAAEVTEENADTVEMAEETPEAEPADETTEDTTETIEDRVAKLEALMGEIKGSLETIVNGISGLEGKITDFEERLAKIEGEPAAEPVEEEVEENETKTRAYYLRKNK